MPLNSVESSLAKICQACHIHVSNKAERTTTRATLVRNACSNMIKSLTDALTKLLMPGTSMRCTW
jgi:hypothetical protein